MNDRDSSMTSLELSNLRSVFNERKTAKTLAVIKSKNLIKTDIHTHFLCAFYEGLMGKDSYTYTAEVRIT